MDIGSSSQQTMMLNVDPYIHGGELPARSPSFHERPFPEAFKSRVYELLQSLLPPPSDLQQEALDKFWTRVDGLPLLSDMLPPPEVLEQLMTGPYQLQSYLILAFIRAYLLPSLEVDDLDLDLDLISSDWGLKDGEGFKTDECVLRLGLPTRSSPFPTPQKAPGFIPGGVNKLPSRPTPFPVLPQNWGFMPRGVDKLPSRPVPFPVPPQTQGFVPGGVDELPPRSFSFQVPPQTSGSMPSGGDELPAQPPFPFPVPPFPQGFMPEGLDELPSSLLQPPPTLHEEFMARVYEVLSQAYPQIPQPAVEQLLLARHREMPLPPPIVLEQLTTVSNELELYLIDTFIKAYVLPSRFRLPKIRLNHKYSELERAALEDRWDDAKRFLDGQKDGGKAAATAWVAPYKMTALHVAAFKGHGRFVKKMVDFMSGDSASLANTDDRGFTVLDYVALNGRKDVAQALTAKNSDLLNSSISGSMKPSVLSIAVLGTSFSNKADNTRVLRFLASNATNEKLVSEDLVNALVFNGHLDILLSLLGRFPKYLDDTSNAASTLMILARTPSNFLSGSGLGFWQRCIYPYIPVEGSHRPSNTMGTNNVFHWLRKLLSNIFLPITQSCIKRIQVSKQKHKCAIEIVNLVWRRILEKDNGVEECFKKEPDILTVAIKTGIIEILRTTFQLCPQLVWVRIRCFLKRNSFLKAAIEYRQEEVFKFLMEDKTCFITENLYTGDSMLHRVAKLAPFLILSCVPGAAMQMQREMQWFKAIEQFVPPTLRYKKEDGLTALELFAREHKELAIAGETWMKDTSNSCMIVSTLITTVVFASAFTVPGGNNTDGVPIFLQTNEFLVFAVSNALALFSSLTSLLMFLAILTARFTAEDFLQSLPKRLIMGLASLFFAIATMIIAFSAALAIVLRDRLEWGSIPIIFLAAIPVTIFGLLQLPLFIQMVKSTYWSTLSTSETWE